MMTRDEWIAKKLRGMRAVAKVARRKLQEERFELEDDRVRISQLYLADKKTLGEAVTISTRAKIHRMLHEALGQIAKGNVPDATRLGTLVRMHLTQLKKLVAEGRMQAKRLPSNRLFYRQMLDTIDTQIWWLNKLR